MMIRCLGGCGDEKDEYQDTILGQRLRLLNYICADCHKRFCGESVSCGSMCKCRKMLEDEPEESHDGANRAILRGMPRAADGG